MLSDDELREIESECESADNAAEVGRIVGQYAVEMARELLELRAIKNNPLPWERLIDGHVAAERERCAAIADKYTSPSNNITREGREYDHGRIDTAEMIAKEIRGGGE